MAASSESTVSQAFFLISFWEEWTLFMISEFRKCLCLNMTRNFQLHYSGKKSNLMWTPDKCLHTSFSFSTEMTSDFTVWGSVLECFHLSLPIANNWYPLLLWQACYHMINATPSLSSINFQGWLWELCNTLLYIHFNYHNYKQIPEEGHTITLRKSYLKGNVTLRVTITLRKSPRAAFYKSLPIPKLIWAQSFLCMYRLHHMID